MKIFFGLALLFVSFAKASTWSSPAIECVEDIVPQIPNEVCLDLSQVSDPIKDFPSSFTEEEIAEWKRKRKVLTHCRYEEIKRRERLNPGSQSPDSLKVAWMLESAIATRDVKIAAVYRASREHKIPYTILAGAIRQESLFASLGISPDGNNYSCSIGQFNIVSWCLWLNQQSSQLRQQMGWPENLNCNQLSAPMVKPFYDLAVRNLGSTPVYKLDWEHFKNIQYNQVKSQLGQGSEQVLTTRYQAVMSFAKNCIDPIYGIQAKANEIARVYRDFVPAGLKQVQQYKAGEKWPAQCREKGFEGSYPFHTGWVLAVGMYNAGPRILNTLAHYWGWTSSSVTQPQTFSSVFPTDLVEGLYWGGRYDKNTDEIVNTTLSGASSRTSWYKMCVVQRHVARIIQHSTKTGTTPLVDSLEGPNTCKPATRDPNTGQIITSAPVARQNSKGTKN